MAELPKAQPQGMPSGRTPGWNLQPTICLRSIQRAAESDIVSLVDPSVNVNSATKPGMMSIKNLAKNSPVGVLKRCCTTKSGPMGDRQSSADFAAKRRRRNQPASVIRGAKL
ncbi:hypothetical protein [Bradyrhizobium sp. JR3.5]